MSNFVYLPTCLCLGRNSGQDQNVNIANSSPENNVKFKYCGTTLTDLNCMKEEMKERLNWGGMRATSRSRIVLSSSLLYKSMKVVSYNEGKTQAQGVQE